MTDPHGQGLGEKKPSATSPGASNLVHDERDRTRPGPAMSDDETARCATCEGRLVPVLYGLPVMTPELEAALAAGDVVLGGCDPTSGPRLRCPSCPEPERTR